MKNCRECGLPVSRKPGAPGPVSEYCSQLCKGRWLNARSKADGRQAVWGETSRLRKRLPDVPCTYCAAPMRPHRKQCGADPCRIRWNSDRARRYYIDRGGSKSFSRNFDRENELRRARYAAGKRRPWTPARQAAYHKRRALKCGAAAESFTTTEIFARDGWRCGICGRAVSSKLRWPDPKSPSLDHIVPLSQGGDHTRANTRLAHLTCNVKRSNRGGDEQLRLIG